MTLNIVIVGVGGQGALLASKILGNLAIRRGLDVKVSEVHGMSQRGGSVITHVRMGSRVLAPLVTEGEADAVLAFEPLEALRALPFVKPGGRVVVNTRQIPPMSVLTGEAEYPQNIIDTIRSRADTLAFDAAALAGAHNAPRAVNIALLGAMAADGSIPADDWRAAIRSSVPPKTIESNLAVFEHARIAHERVPPVPPVPPPPTR
jgi:indolepyruvate ferredoxin oxidoreductase beta subunit